MNGLAQRLLPAAVIALILHGILLCLPVAPDRHVPARSLAVQRIAVSLGSPPVTGKKAPAPPEQASSPKPVGLPESRPSPPAGEIVRKKGPARPQRKKTGTVRRQPARRQSAASRHPPTARKDAPQAPPAVSRPAAVAHSPRPPGPEDENESSRTVPAARVVLRATPLYRVNPPPRYPRLARRRGLEGAVLLEVLVDVSGRVADIRIASSSGHAILDRAALEAVRRWRFTPGMVGGKRRQMWVTVPVRFQLR